MNNYPIEFLKQMQTMLGDEYPAFLQAMEMRPALALRLNPKRTHAESASTPLIECPVPWESHGRYLRSTDIKPGSTILHAAGAFYMQEASAMVSVAVLKPQPGEKILDLCAAPGGKSSQIAAAMQDQGMLISNDPETSRSRILAGNLERMGAANAIVVNAYPDQLAQQWPDCFDALLVDAPCSGEGMFRRDPDARSEWNPASPEGCAKRQAEILDQAANLLRPGGRMVYSTCTFNNAENEGSILNFLNRHPEFSTEEFHLEGVGDSENGMLHIYPHRVNGDGHFVARLRKAENAPAATKPSPKSMRKGRKANPVKRDPDLSEWIALLTRDVCTLPDTITQQKYFACGDWVYCAPQSAPDLSGIHVISPGLCLFKMGRSHVEPAHALAMALPPEMAHRRAELDFEKARQYLSGEAMEFEGEKGWTLVLYKGMPLGWGKVSNGILKNHLPSGLRMHQITEI